MRPGFSAHAPPPNPPPRSHFWTATAKRCDDRVTRDVRFMKCHSECEVIFHLAAETTRRPEESRGFHHLKRFRDGNSQIRRTGCRRVFHQNRRVTRRSQKRLRTPERRRFLTLPLQQSFRSFTCHAARGDPDEASAELRNGEHGPLARDPRLPCLIINTLYRPVSELALEAGEFPRRRVSRLSSTLPGLCRRRSGGRVVSSETQAENRRAGILLDM